MSTLAYAAMTRKREEAQPGKSTTSDAPGLKTYVDALAALVPAEVLTAHAAILTFTTTTLKDKVTINDVGTLFYVFWALIALSMVLYAAGRVMASAWDEWDWLRILIPPLAFVAWTMLQKATAFDAVVLHWSIGWPEAGRSATAIIGAIALGVLASTLAYKADQKPKQP